MGSPKPYRPAADQRPAPAPATELRDEIERTATCVRLDNGRPDSPVHDVVADWSDPHLGVAYRTACNRTLSKVEGAILTTRLATCEGCLRGGR